MRQKARQEKKDLPKHKCEETRIKREDKEIEMLKEKKEGSWKDRFYRSDDKLLNIDDDHEYHNNKGNIKSTMSQRKVQNKEVKLQLLEQY
ncbi:hypothetical protein DPMN_068084 [Dreissena polymorpha]|uniref:Uncharacterized protein n=1 Tax=Dreissena polymorpha TaxID=45954 RepID=A0A9D3YWY3_DREPO|nr:hypothetical protein DPMN_068084 [Dreissena polymorpha]